MPQLPTASSTSATHTVFNQAPPRINLNEYSQNQILRSAVNTFRAGWAEDQLLEVGELTGREDFQRDAELSHTSPPVLEIFDRYGKRVDEVNYHPGYHRIIGEAVRYGAHTSAWADPKPGAEVARAATFMMFAQIEPGHACPISMSHAAVPSLMQSERLAAQWLPRLYSREYTPELAPEGGKSGAIFGMAMTEKQGGSDVRANSTQAVKVQHDEYLITGHKWFCSAPMSDAFLVLANIVENGEPLLSCFLVPRILPDGSKNGFRIQRLKDKVGNKSNASSEIEFDQTLGALIGEPGKGVRTIIEMVSRTRLDCVYGSAAGMRQALAEALWHAQHRSAFGAKLVDQPAMTAVLADLALESEAATLTSMRLARAHDADRHDQDEAFRRLATAAAKYWVCKRGPNHAYEAMECLGGNGYTEAFPLARRYREQPVMAIWEGSGNVIALDIFRAMQRTPESVEAFLTELEVSAGVNKTYDLHLDETKDLISSIMSDGDQDYAARQSRRLVEDFALALQSSLMLRYSDGNSADAFIEARIGASRGHEYGQLPATTDLKLILRRQ